jgi:hypothetical protein
MGELDMAFTKTPMTEEERKVSRRAASLRDYHKNIEKRRADQNARKQADPDKTAAQRRGYRAANLEVYREYGRKDFHVRREKYPWLAAFNSRRKHAEKKGLPFTITTEWCKATYSGFCTLTGIPFIVYPQGHKGAAGPKPHSVSIDRIKQTEGYTPGNCRFVLHAVNVMRGSGTDAGMHLVIKALLVQQENS